MAFKQAHQSTTDFFPCIYSFTYALEGNKAPDTCPWCISMVGLLDLIKALYYRIILVAMFFSQTQSKAKR